MDKPLPAALPPGCVLLRMAHAGINASDVNYSSGRYVGTPQQAAAQLPLAAGFEGVGTVVATAGDVTGKGIKIWVELSDMCNTDNLKGRCGWWRWRGQEHGPGGGRGR